MQIEKHEDNMNYGCNGCDFCINGGRHLERQSLSQKIEQDVAGCDERVTIIQDKVLIPVRCREAPEAQKCDGCKRMLELQRSIEGDNNRPLSKNQENLEG